MCASLVSANGLRINTMLSVNTATHPAYQGKGLFTQLVERSHAAVTVGLTSVHSVDKADSMPRFSRKLGCRLIEPLRACIGFGSFYSEYAWRCVKPANRVRHCMQGDLVQFNARGHNHLLSAYAELPARYSVMPDDAPFASLGARLFLGLIPEHAKRFQFYGDIPLCLRPSPLNFIYRYFSDNDGRL